MPETERDGVAGLVELLKLSGSNQVVLMIVRKDDRRNVIAMTFRSFHAALLCLKNRPEGQSLSQSKFGP